MPRNAQPVLEEAPSVDPVVCPVDGATAEVARVETAAMGPVRQSSGELDLILRAANDPNTPIDKMERLVALYERMIDRRARSEFEAAFAEMQGELPVVDERGKIVVNGQTRSTYARFEDIVEAVRPILAKHGFALRHQNKQDGDKITVIGILSHRGGHSERDEFIAEGDDSGQKNDIQQIGSTRAYGMRYTTIALLNIVTRGVDDDGQSRRPAAVRPSEPQGYAAFREKAQATAMQGLTKLTALWGEDSTPRSYIHANDRLWWNDLKRVAEQVGK